MVSVCETCGRDMYVEKSLDNSIDNAELCDGCDKVEGSCNCDPLED